LPDGGAAFADASMMAISSSRIRFAARRTEAALISLKLTNAIFFKSHLSTILSSALSLLCDDVPTFFTRVFLRLFELRREFNSRQEVDRSVCRHSPCLDTLAQLLRRTRKVCLI
jgi:hypothetical protein